MDNTRNSDWRHSELIRVKVGRAECTCCLTKEQNNYRCRFLWFSLLQINTLSLIPLNKYIFFPSHSSSWAVCLCGSRWRLTSGAAASLRSNRLRKNTQRPWSPSRRCHLSIYILYTLPEQTLDGTFIQCSFLYIAFSVILINFATNRRWKKIIMSNCSKHR